MGCPISQVGIFRRGKYAGGKRVGKGDAVDEVSKEVNNLFSL